MLLADGPRFVPLDNTALGYTFFADVNVTLRLEKNDVDAAGKKLGWDDTFANSGAVFVKELVNLIIV